ncbi:MAG: hypothetical protein WCG78_01625 [Candidatus Omnitrophota bacterium]
MNGKMTCCESCKIFWSCETKWYRGERAEENICCTVCDFYQECLKNPKSRHKKHAA